MAWELYIGSRKRGVNESIVRLSRTSRLTISGDLNPDEKNDCLIYIDKESKKIGIVFCDHTGRTIKVYRNGNRSEMFIGYALKKIGKNQEEIVGIPESGRTKATSKKLNYELEGGMIVLSF